jgi:hypothetical protein
MTRAAARSDTTCSSAPRKTDNYEQRFLIASIPMFHLLADYDIPSSWFEPLLLPFFFSLGAVIIWFSGHVAEVKGGRKVPWKWSAALLFFLALWSGWAPFHAVQLSDTAAFYKSQFEGAGRKWVAAHYLAFLLPFLIIVGIAAFHAVERVIHRDRG